MLKHALLGLVSVAILISTAIGQDGRYGPELPTKVEEFEFTTQEAAKPLVDAFLESLNNRCGGKAHVIVYPRNAVQRLTIEDLVAKQVKIKDVDASRILMVKGPINRVGIVQLWIVPLGSVPPKPILGKETDAKLLQTGSSGVRVPPGCGTGVGMAPNYKN
jgi:hypothetical protein